MSSWNPRQNPASSSNPNRNENPARSGTKRKLRLFGVDIEFDDQSTAADASQHRHGSSGASANHASEDDDGKSLKVNVWTPSGEMIVILMRQDDTVSSLQEELEKEIDIPADDQALTYKQYWLDSENTFKDYGIETSCTVHVGWKPYSYKTKTMRGRTGDMMTAAARLCQGQSDPSLKVDVRKFVPHFLEKARNDGEEMCRRYFDVFTSMSAAYMLSRLYLSHIETNKKLGGRVIERFMAGAAKLRKSLQPYALPSVFQFCIHLRTMDPREPLYILCRSTMRSLVDIAFHPKYAHVEGNDWLRENNDMLGFESRKHLAMMMFPHLSDEDEFPTGLIRRSNLLDDSFGHIAQTHAEHIRDGVSIKFRNEEATGPGVLREWFILVSKELFNPHNALFMANTNDHRRLYINPASKVEASHLKYFQFCGRVIALALIHDVQIGIAFDRVFFVQLAGFDVQLEDIRDTDPTLYRSCNQILEMDADLVDSDALGLTFVAEYEEFGCRQVVELCRGGARKRVNSSNRRDYVSALIHNRFVMSTKKQVTRFRKGFEDIISNRERLSFFFNCINLEDLDRMLTGSDSDISVEDWKMHTDCKGYKDTDRQIRWFWKIIDKMSPEERRNLLFFWTSIMYLPIHGFSGLARRLEIYKAPGTTNHLPSSHTCFFHICLPVYESYKMMQERLALVVDKHVATSFGNV
uniref:HECT-type E3 ubiquitin transferase n=1 Tax=Kalanchoe fedtschenkoi TaxID=63787 RepID=A0A7N0UC86_KALFE